MELTEEILPAATEDITAQLDEDIVPKPFDLTGNYLLLKHIIKNDKEQIIEWTNSYICCIYQTLKITNVNDG